MLPLVLAAALLAAQDAPPSLVDVPPEEVLESASHRPDPTPLPTPTEIRGSIDAGVAYLLSTQKDDGSWGSWHEPSSNDWFWINLETHASFITATTSIVVMALLEVPETPEIRAALDRALRYIVDQDPLKRPSDWDVDNVWGYIYGLNAMTKALMDPRYAEGDMRDALIAKAEHFAERMARYQTPDGTWGYYQFDTVTPRPTWGTSFVTAVAIVGMEEGRRLGIDLPERLLDRSVKALHRCRLANGAYSYSHDAVPRIAYSEWIDQVKGSLGRIQVGNYALALAGHEEITDDVLRWGLDQFFEHHRFLDIAYQKPTPHETYYLNSGYFYFFGHYYAALVLELLPAADRVAYQSRLAREIIKTQKDDGSMWDWKMLTYHRAYGTAYGVMTLNRALPSWWEGR